MKRQSMILAGTALGLLMASAPLGAFPLQGSAGFGQVKAAAQFPSILAQSNCAEGESAEDCAAKQAPARRKAPAGEQAVPDEQQQPRRKKPRDAAEPAPAEEAAPRAQRNAAPAGEQAAPD